MLDAHLRPQEERTVCRIRDFLQEASHYGIFDLDPNVLLAFRRDAVQVSPLAATADTPSLRKRLAYVDYQHDGLLYTTKCIPDHVAMTSEER